MSVSEVLLLLFSCLDWQYIARKRKKFLRPICKSRIFVKGLNSGCPDLLSIPYSCIVPEYLLSKQSLEQYAETSERDSRSFNRSHHNMSPFILPVLNPAAVDFVGSMQTIWVCCWPNTNRVEILINKFLAKFPLKLLEEVLSKQSH